MAPLPNGGGVDRTLDLHCACSGARGVILIKAQDIVLPRQTEKLGQAPARLLLVSNKIVSAVPKETRRWPDALLALLSF
jgi:hypothetical protein